MRIKVEVNGEQVCLAAVDTAGYLGAHLNLSNRAAPEGSQCVLRLSGIETHSKESVYLDWPEMPLQVGDVVSLTLARDGAPSEPASRRKSSELPSNLVIGDELAKHVLAACASFDSELQKVLFEGKARLTEEAYASLLRSVAQIVSGLGDTLLFPIYRAHPDLVPDDLKGEML